MLLERDITGYKQSATVCVLNEDVYSKLSLRNKNLCKQRDAHPQIEFDFDEKHNNTLKVVFVEHHVPFNVYDSHRSQIQFEDEDHAVYIGFR